MNLNPVFSMSILLLLFISPVCSGDCRLDVPRAVEPTSDFNHFIEFLKKSSFMSLDELGPALKAKKSGLGALWTPVRKSGSFHGNEINPLEPRVIVALDPKSGTPTLAMRACPKNPKPPLSPYPLCERLEVKRFDSKTNETTLYLVSFPGPNAPPGSKAIFSLPNSGPHLPSEKGVCVTCHGNPARSRIESYNMWPGFYGSLSRDGFDVIARGSQEKHDYVASEKVLKESPRFSFLEWHNKSDPNRFNETFKQISNAYNSGGTQVDPIWHSKYQDPNAEFTHLFEYQNGRQIAQELLNKINTYPETRFLFAALSLGCVVGGAELSMIDEFFPKGYSALERKRATRALKAEDYFKQVKNISEKEYKAVASAILEVNPITKGGFQPDSYEGIGSLDSGADLGYAYMRLGIPGGPGTWSLGTRHFDFKGPRGSALDFARKNVLEALKICEPELSQKSKADCSELAFESCKEFARRSGRKNSCKLKNSGNSSNPLKVLSPSQSNSTSSLPIQ